MWNENDLSSIQRVNLILILQFDEEPTSIISH